MSNFTTELPEEVRHVSTHCSPAVPRNKYMREIKPGVWIDVYDVLKAWQIVNPAQQHAAKKILQAGNRGHKDYRTDMDEVISAVNRAKDLEAP